jgi:hypothetical protein
VSEILRSDRMALAQPRRHAHALATACPIQIVWGIDMSEHRSSPNITQNIFGIIDQGSRRVLTIDTMREKSSIAILRLLLDAIKHYGKPKKIRTDNEAVFTSWVFAFALRWLGICHQTAMPMDERPDRTRVVNLQTTAADVRPTQRSRTAGNARHVRTCSRRINRLSACFAGAAVHGCVNRPLKTCCRWYFSSLLEP